MNQYARNAHFNEYMRKEQFNQSINDDIKQISMSGYRSNQTTLIGFTCLINIITN